MWKSRALNNILKCGNQEPNIKSIGVALSKRDSLYGNQEPNIYFHLYRALSGLFRLFGLSISTRRVFWGDSCSKSPFWAIYTSNGDIRGAKIREIPRVSGFPEIRVISPRPANMRIWKLLKFKWSFYREKFSPPQALKISTLDYA